MRIVLGIAMIVFLGCEAITEADGYVISAQTNRPISGVLVKSYFRTKFRKKYRSEMITDSTGYFYGTTQMTGCAGGCPDLVLEFIKSGYSTKEITNPEMDTVYLEN